MKGKHLKFRVEQDGKAMDAIGWNMAQRHPQTIDSNKKVSLAFAISLNSYQGMNSLQLIVRDIQD